MRSSYYVSGRRLPKRRWPKGAIGRLKILRWELGNRTIEFVDKFPFDKIYHGCILWRITSCRVDLKGRAVREIFWSVPIPEENIGRGWYYRETLQNSVARAWSDFCERREQEEE